MVMLHGGCLSYLYMSYMGFHTPNLKFQLNLFEWKSVYRSFESELVKAFNKSFFLKVKLMLKIVLVHQKILFFDEMSEFSISVWIGNIVRLFPQTYNGNIH